MLRVHPDAKIGLPPIDNGSSMWMEKWTHVLEEMQLRHGPFPAGFTREILHCDPLPDFVSDLSEKAARKLSSLGLNKGEVFIKFGKRAHMERLHETGSVRIQPANFFSAKDHNGAVRDDELTLPISLVLSRDDVTKVVVNPQDVPSDATDQRVDVKFRFPTDYWLYCVTNSIEPRLFADFKSDLCVIIKDRKMFSRMLGEASKKILPTSEMKEGSVTYIDPLLPTSVNIFVPLAKQFSFAYQEEYCFYWLPSQPSKMLKHKDIEIGNLKAFSDLIIL